MKYIKKNQNLRGKYLGISAVECAHIIQSYFEFSNFHSTIEDAGIKDAMGCFEAWWNEYIAAERADQGTLCDQVVHCLICDQIYWEDGEVEECPFCGNADTQLTQFLQGEGDSPHELALGLKNTIPTDESRW